MCTSTFVCINQLSPPPSLPVVYGSPAGSHISLPLWWWHTWFMAFRDRLFSLRLLVSSLAVSRFRATQANSGQNERKECQGERFFLALKETKGLGFGMDKKLKAEWRTAVAAFFFFFQLLLRFRGSQGFLKCQCWKTRSWKTTEKSKSWQLLQHSVWCSQFFLSFKSSAL